MPSFDGHRFFILHKPFGYLSQFVCELKKKKLLGELYDFPPGTMAIGRLDEDSEGLLLLTTSGIMSERVRSPLIDKEYLVQLDGAITPEAVDRLRKGVTIGIRNQKYLTQPCKVEVPETIPRFPPRTKSIRSDRHGPTSWISIVLNEGKFRQIRKMTAAAGFPTLRLFRVRIGHLHLGDLKAGEVREADETVFSFPGNFDGGQSDDLSNEIGPDYTIIP